MHIAELSIHPIKGCRPVAVQEATLDERGLAGDRRWMVTDDAGTYLTQRTEPRLALLSVDRTDQGWRLVAPGLQPLRIADDEATEPRDVVIWGDRVRALAHGRASEWLAAFLGREVELVRFAGERRAGSRTPEAPVAFVDAYPILLIGRSSLDELNRRLAEPVPMSRFRPNVVVEGAEPFAEDGWDRFELGEVSARMVKPCDRCSVVTVDGTTGRRGGKEPLATLATFRREGRKVLFGVNVIHERTGTLRVGDPVRLAGGQPRP